MSFSEIFTFSGMLTATKVFTVGILVAGMTGYGILLAGMYFLGWWKPTRETLEKSPELAFGLPFSAIASFGVVALLESTESGSGTAGKLSFKAFGLDFDGPAGPVTLWLLCFGAFVLAIKHLRRVSTAYAAADAAVPRAFQKHRPLKFFRPIPISGGVGGSPLDDPCFHSICNFR